MNSATKIKSLYKAPFKDKIFCIFILCVFIIMLFYQSSYIQGMKNGINFCINTLIPSLFPFMFLSSFIVKSGISNTLGKILYPITKTLFYLPGCCGSAIILGLTGGYPTGAKATNELLVSNLINNEQANRMMAFNIGAGPAFIIGTVGEILLKNKYIGLAIFTSQIFVSIIMGIILGIRARINKKVFYEQSNSQHNIKYGYSNSLILSCRDAVCSTVNMCSLVVLFSTFISIADSIHLNDLITQILSLINVPKTISQVLIPILLEVNVGCISISRLIYSPSLIAFAIGWCGFCVHCQIFSSFTSEKTLNIRNFLFFRLAQGVGASIIVYIFIKLFNPTVITSYVLNTNTLTRSNIGISSSIQGVFALILVCIYFINNLFDIFNSRNPVNKPSVLNDKIKKLYY